MSADSLILAPYELQRAVHPAESTSGMHIDAAQQSVTPANDSADENRPAGTPNRGAWKWGTAVLFAAVAATTYLGPWQSRANQDGVSSAAHDADAVRSVTIDHPTAAGSSNVTLPATIRPWQTATLHARVSGYLAAWHHDLGEPVKTGDLLAQIDTPELDQELAEGQALVREAAAATAQARAERIEAEADLKVAETQLVKVRAEVELSQGQFARRKLLLEKRAVSQEEHDTFQRDLSVRNADLVAAESDVARRRANLNTRTAIIQAREATEKSRQSNVDRLNELQIFKRIVAPFDGVVTRRAAEVGMLVTAGEEPLFVVEDMSRVRVQVNVPQAYSVQTITGAEATVSLPEAATEAVRAKITRITNSVDVQSRTMLAEIELDNAGLHFQPGSYAQVALQTRSNDGWTIPTNTVQMRVEGPHVAVVDQRNQIQLKPVTLGRDLGTRVVAIEGIHGDERLVINPSDDLVRGLRVQVSESREPIREIAQR